MSLEGTLRVALSRDVLAAPAMLLAAIWVLLKSRLR